jgi:phosphomannomutase
VDGRFINKRELGRFKKFLSRQNDREYETIRNKSMKRTDAIDRHIDRILKTINARAPHLLVAIDAVNGAGSKALPRLVRAMGCRVYKVHCTPSPYFPRGPEPRPEHLSQLSHLVRVKYCDVGFACDPDCDRLSIVDETGRAIGEDMSIVLAADYILGSHKGPVVTNFSTTSLLEHICDLHKCSLFRTKVGEAYVVEKMQQVKAVFGGEGNGGIIDPRINMTRDALVGAALIIALLTERGKTVSAIMKSYPSRFMVKAKVRATRERFDRKQERLRKMLRGRVNTTDGMRITSKDYWLHIRPSQTEPVVRIIGESSQEELIRSLVQKIQRLLS